jgi:hypothetical protein
MTVYQVWDSGADDSEAREIDADDAEEAAKKYAERELREDPGGESNYFELVVRDDAGTESVVDVTIEWSPDFYAVERRATPAKAVQP